MEAHWQAPKQIKIGLFIKKKFFIFAQHFIVINKSN